MITFTSTTKTMWEIRTLILGFYFKSFMANILSVFLTTVIDQYYLVDKTYSIRESSEFFTTHFIDLIYEIFLRVFV